MPVPSLPARADPWQPKPSAVRSFPPGCGRRPAGASDPTDGPSESDEFLDQMGSQDSDQETPQLLKWSSDPPQEKRPSVSETYPPPEKRRRVFAIAIRTFPIGCGRNASPIIGKDGSLEANNTNQSGGEVQEMPMDAGVHPFLSNCPVGNSSEKPTQDKVLARSQSGRKEVDNLKDQKSLEGKVTEESGRGNLIAKNQDQGDVGPSEVRGDRVVVQALMAASNCPWRRGRNRSCAFGSRSADGKAKVRKGKSLSPSA